MKSTSRIIKNETDMCPDQKYVLEKYDEGYSVKVTLVSKDGKRELWDRSNFEFFLTFEEIELLNEMEKELSAL